MKFFFILELCIIISVSTREESQDLPGDPHRKPTEMMMSRQKKKPMIQKKMRREDL
jgi:hypothetical protein